MDGSKMKMMEEGSADKGYDRKQMFMEMIAAKRGKKGKPGKAKKKPAKKAKPKGKKSKRGKSPKSKGSMAGQMDKIFGGKY